MTITGGNELREALVAIRAGAPKPAYLVHGTESYLVRTAADAIVRALVEQTGGEVVHEDAEGRDADSLLAPLSALSLFASSRVTVVRNFAHLLAGESGERLLAGLDVGLTEGNAVVFVATPGPGGGAGGGEGKVDKRGKGFKGLVKRGVVIELNTQKPEALAIWLREKAAEDAKKLTPAAAELLLSRAGTDMEVLRLELDKALLYCLDQKTIDAPDLDSLVGKSREDAVWEITDAVRSGSASRALTLLTDLLVRGTYPLVLLTLLIRQARHLLQARLLWETAGCPAFRDVRSFQARVGSTFEAGAFGKGADDVTTIHPFASFKRFEAARKVRPEILRAMLGRLRRADRDAKTGAAAGTREALEELILDLCAMSREAA